MRGIFGRCCTVQTKIFSVSILTVKFTGLSLNVSEEQGRHSCSLENLSKQQSVLSSIQSNTARDLSFPRPVKEKYVHIDKFVLGFSSHFMPLNTNVLSARRTPILKGKIPLSHCGLLFPQILCLRPDTDAE